MVVSCALVHGQFSNTPHKKKGPSEAGLAVLRTYRSSTNVRVSPSGLSATAIHTNAGGNSCLQIVHEDIT